MNSASNTPYDDAFKDLADQNPAALLLLLGAITLEEKAEIEALPRELRAAKRAADQPYLIRSERGARIAHLEAQTRYRGDEPQRLLEYALYLLLSSRWQYPIESYLLVLTPEGAPTEFPTSHTVSLGSLQLTINLHVVLAWQLPAALALQWGVPDLLPFVPLMDGGREALEEAAARVIGLADEHRRDTLALNLLALGSLRYTASEVIALFGRSSMNFVELVKDEPNFRELIRLIAGPEIEAMRAKMLREEIAAGKEIGERETLLRLLNYQITKKYAGQAWRAELERLHEPAKLEQLFRELDQLNDEIALRQRINELAASKDNKINQDVNGQH